MDSSSTIFPDDTILNNDYQLNRSPKQDCFFTAESILNYHQTLLVDVINNSNIYVSVHQKFLGTLLDVSLSGQNAVLEALYNFLKQFICPEDTVAMTTWGCVAKAYLYNLDSCNFVKNWNQLLDIYYNVSKTKNLSADTDWTELLLFQIVADIFSIRPDYHVIENHDLIIERCKIMIDSYLNQKGVDDIRKSVVLTYAIIAYLCYADDNQLNEMKKYRPQFNSSWIATDYLDYLKSELETYQGDINQSAKNPQEKILLIDRFNSILE